jgi:hypothetical protein
VPGVVDLFVPKKHGVHDAVDASLDDHDDHATTAHALNDHF